MVKSRHEMHKRQEFHWGGEREEKRRAQIDKDLEQGDKNGIENKPQ